MDMAKRKVEPGTIIQIDLTETEHTYARALKHPFIAVYDARTTEQMAPREIVSRPVLFVVSVYDRALNRWKSIGKAPLDPDELPIPDQFIQDILNPADCRIIDADGVTRNATSQECIGLEAAAVWDAEQLVGRIRDHYTGLKNVFLESLSLKK